MNNIKINNFEYGGNQTFFDFSNLNVQFEKLELKNIYGNNKEFLNFLKNLKNIKELKLDGYNIYTDPDDDFEYDKSLATIINKHLTLLSLHHLEIYYDVICMILENNETITDLSFIENYEWSISDTILIQENKNLKKLELPFWNRDIFLNESIEELHIHSRWFCTSKDDIKLLQENKNIKKIYFKSFYYINVPFQEYLMTNPPSLEELVYYHYNGGLLKDEFDIAKNILEALYENKYIKRLYIQYMYQIDKNLLFNEIKNLSLYNYTIQDYNCR